MKPKTSRPPNRSDISAALNEKQRRGGNTPIDSMLGKASERYLLSNRVASLQWLNGRIVESKAHRAIVLDNRQGADGIELLVRNSKGETYWTPIALIEF